MYDIANTAVYRMIRQNALYFERQSRIELMRNRIFVAFGHMQELGHTLTNKEQKESMLNAWNTFLSNQVKKHLYV